jgi:uncharacterized protein with FMN-binding domain
LPKVLAALIATAAGLAALLSFRSHGPAAATLTAVGGATPAPAASSPRASATAATGAGRGKNGSYTGSAADTPFGPVQVSATVSGGKLTDVTVLQVPDNGRYEEQIVAQALPILRSEALSNQNAHIDVVSGATYTSQGYAQSLQSALDQAGL